MTFVNRIQAPWTAEQVDALNRWQWCGWTHEFTCAAINHADDGSDRTLVATRNGWICPHCDYTQDWAHEAMLTLPEVPGGPEPNRFERFVMRAIWLMFWLHIQQGASREDQTRILRWRHDYYQAGGGPVEAEAE